VSEGVRSVTERPGSGPGAVGAPSEGAGLSPDLPPLERALAVLAGRGIRFAVLREPEARHGESGVTPREVDVLVAPGDMARTARILERFGFAETPAWGHAPHRFFLHFDSRRGTWTKLDVVHDLRYGRSIRCIRAGDPAGCLRRAGRDGRMSAADELVTLVLHCVLDRGRFAARHQRRITGLLRGLRAGPSAASDAADRVRRQLGPALEWEALARAVEAGRWDELAGRRTALLRQLLRRDPAATGRWLLGWVGRRVRPLLFALERRGRSVALLGGDGAGKSTHARNLQREPALRARRVYLGGNAASANVCLPTSRWLGRGTRSGSPGRWTSLPWRGLRFLNRIAECWFRHAVARYHLLRGRTVVFDRYPFELGAAPRRTALRRAAHRLRDVGRPEPDLVVVLDAPGETLHRRSGEHSPDRLEEMRERLLALSARLPRAVVVDTTRPPGDVRREVVAQIWSMRSGNDAAEPGPEGADEQ